MKRAPAQVHNQIHIIRFVRSALVPAKTITCHRYCNTAASPCHCLPCAACRHSNNLLAPLPLGIPLSFQILQQSVGLVQWQGIRTMRAPSSNVSTGWPGHKNVSAFTKRCTAMICSKPEDFDALLYIRYKASEQLHRRNVSVYESCSVALRPNLDVKNTRKHVFLLQTALPTTHTSLADVACVTNKCIAGVKLT